MTVGSHWWGTFTIPEGRAGRFRIGSLVVTVLRLPHEWQVSREQASTSNDAEVRVEVPAELAESELSSNVTRYATASRTESFRMLPVLPDRTVLTRPERPLTILPHTEVTLYVGSPVWVRLLQGDDEILGDLPASSPKEAWLGPNTREGELCYATRTHGRLTLDAGALRPHRVMTAVSIRNGADAPFVCRQVNLPVPRLSVYGSADGRLWTEAVTLERTSAAAFAKVHVEDKPPPAAAHAELISGPREKGASASVFRAFGTLFG